MDPSKQKEVDQKMIELDGTDNKVGPCCCTNTPVLLLHECRCTPVHPTAARMPLHASSYYAADALPCKCCCTNAAGWQCLLRPALAACCSDPPVSPLRNRCGTCLCNDCCQFQPVPSVFCYRASGAQRQSCVGRVRVGLTSPFQRQIAVLL